MRTRRIKEEKINDYLDGLKKLKAVLDYGQPEVSLTQFLKMNNMNGYAKDVLFRIGVIHNVDDKLKWNGTEPTRSMAVDVIREVNLIFWKSKQKSLNKIRLRQEENQTSFVTFENLGQSLKNLEHLSLKSIRDKKEQQLATDTTTAVTKEEANRVLNLSFEPKNKTKKNKSVTERCPLLVEKSTSYLWGLITIKTRYRYDNI